MRAASLSKLALLAACVVGLALRLWHLDAASLFSDEAFTFAVGGLALPTLLQTLASSDFHPPLFYLVTHALMHGLHWPLWDYRFLSAPVGVVTIVATWGAARKIASETVACVAAIVVAVSPALVAYDRMYRMYVVLVSACTLSWWLLLEAQRAKGSARAWLWAGYGACVLAAAYTHYLAWLVLATQAIYALVWRPARPALAGVTVVMLAYVPWLTHLARQVPLGAMTMSRPAIDAGLAASFRGAFAPGISDALWALPGALWAPLVLAVACMLVSGWLAKDTALPFWLAALPLAVVVSIAADKNVAYFPQYLLIDVPPLAVGIGVIAARIGSMRAPIAAAALCAGLVAVLGASDANVLANPYYQFPDWYAVNALMLANERPSDAVVLDAGYERLVVSAYTAFRGRTVLSFMNPADFALIFSWIRQHPGVRVWYLEHQHEYWDPQRRIMSALSDRRVVLAHDFARQFAVNDVRVVLFDELPMTKRR